MLWVLRDNCKLLHVVNVDKSIAVFSISLSLSLSLAASLSFSSVKFSQFSRRFRQIDSSRNLGNSLFELFIGSLNVGWLSPRLSLFSL